MQHSHKVPTVGSSPTLATMNNSPCDTCIHWHPLCPPLCNNNTCCYGEDINDGIWHEYYCDENEDGTVALDHCPIGGYESRPL